jgi:hypothetical protein
VEAAFEYFCDFEGARIFRKSKRQLDPEKLLVYFTLVVRG